MSDIKHSPLPFSGTGMADDIFWLHDATGECLTSGVDCIFTKADAEFMIRACNSHYQLIEALELVNDHIKNGGERIPFVDKVISKAKGGFND